MMAKAVEESFRLDPLKMKVGRVEVGPTGFVDDVANLRGDKRGAQSAGASLTRAVDEVSLAAHPQKTINLVIGTKKLREELKEELAEDPMKLQGFDVKSDKDGMYLGMRFSEAGPSDGHTVPGATGG